MTDVSEIRWAAVEVQQGRLELAAARFQQVRPPVADGSGTGTAFNFYQTLGELHFRRRDLAEAEKALRNALRIGDLQLSSLGTDADRVGWERDAAPAYRTLVELYVQKAEAIRALEVWEGYLAGALRGPKLSSFGSDLYRNLERAEPAVSSASSHIRSRLSNMKELFLSCSYPPSRRVGVRRSGGELRVGGCFGGGGGRSC